MGLLHGSWQSLPEVSALAATLRPQTATLQFFFHVFKVFVLINQKIMCFSLNSP